MKFLQELKNQLTMIKGLVLSVDKAIYQGLDSQSIDWLQSAYCNDKLIVDNALYNATKKVEMASRDLLDAQRELAEIVDNRIAEIN